MTQPQDHGQLRSFGRSFTKKLGLLSRNPYHDDLTLLQSRIIFEIHHRGDVLSGELARSLQLDKGYMSRSVSQLLKSGLLRASENPLDKREKFLRLTKKGERFFAKIDRASKDRSAEFLRSLRPGTSQEFIGHLASSELLMGEEPLRGEEIATRSLSPGDIGWVIERHGELYHREFGWDMDFERLVGEIAVSFAARHDPAKERAWIAEARGVRLGCVFLVQESEEVAKLRILLVEPIARGVGLGTRLVRECIEFARAAGYRKITLWTNSVLHSARKIYVAEGFRLVKEEPHRSFGKDLVGQYWELGLSEKRRG